jgi:hypothetical protein
MIAAVTRGAAIRERLGGLVRRLDRALVRAGEGCCQGRSRAALARALERRPPRP